MADYLALARTVDREGFEERFPHPFLVVTREHSADATREFRTRDISALELNSDRPPSLEVFPVNRPSSPANHMVTLGRANNMDIVLPNPSVSKLHAYFQRDIEGSRWTVADAGSRNGSTLNGSVLAPKASHPVNTGDILVFAQLYRAEFLMPGDVYSRFVKL